MRINASITKYHYLNSLHSHGDTHVNIVTQLQNDLHKYATLLINSLPYNIKSLHF